MADEVLGEASILSSPTSRSYGQLSLPAKVAFTLQIKKDFVKYLKDDNSTIFTHRKVWKFKFYLEYLY